MKQILQICVALFLVACGDKKVKTVSVEPSEEIINKYSGTDIAVVLDDMKIDESEDTISYNHKYKVLKMIAVQGKKDSLVEEKRDWASVNEDFFQKHKEDLGMEILSKHNGVISRVAQPVGMGWAIGNSAHGTWEEVKDSTHTTHRRWRTHHTSPFFWYWLGTRRNYSYNGYQNYQNAKASGQSFYGKNSNGKYEYGTRSTYQENKRSSFYSRRKTNSSRWLKLGRSTSRYSKGSSTRSRSGGFGK